MTTNRFTPQQRARRNALADAAARLPLPLLPTYPDTGPPRDHGAVIAARTPQLFGHNLLDPTTSLCVRPWKEALNPLRAARQMGRTRAAEISKDEGFLGAAELIVSELVTNAVRHSGGDVWVEFPQAPWSFVVKVLDQSSRAPHECDATADDLSGRGLLLVRMTAAEYGGEYVVEGNERGKAVVCWLPVPIAMRREKSA
ncbi:ATP-binding protein [Streptomyces sp. WAC 06725]|uniref:ATP-binding protein n=1 Tax=Streptomyces sp. WAC 06725 TaxID=2203209 RepID=UPI0021AD6919|nr:ATP-binding protein [Streptomyces sp. WAC 06725]